MLSCKKCGFQTNDNVAFCPQCGEAVTANQNDFYSNAAALR